MLPMIKQFFSDKAEAAKPRYTQVRAIQTFKTHPTKGLVLVTEFFNARTGLKITDVQIIQVKGGYYTCSDCEKPNPVKLAREVFETLEYDLSGDGFYGPVRKSKQGHYWKLVSGSLEVSEGVNL